MRMDLQFCVKGLQHIFEGYVELLTCASSKKYTSGLQQLQRHRVETTRTVIAQLVFSPTSFRCQWRQLRMKTTFKSRKAVSTANQNVNTVIAGSTPA